MLFNQCTFSYRTVKQVDKSANVYDTDLKRIILLIRDNVLDYTVPWYFAMTYVWKLRSKLSGIKIQQPHVEINAHAFIAPEKFKKLQFYTNN